MKQETDFLFDWLVKVIDSCTHQMQLDSAAVLVERYMEIQKDHTRYNDLRLRMVEKSHDIHYVVI
jgi:hypothetical protein